MVLDAETLALVEREGFKTLMAVVAPCYSLSSRPYLSQTALPNLKTKVKEKIRKILHDIKYLAFITNIRSNSNNNASFICLTSHYISVQSFEKKLMTLAVRHFHKKHAGQNIADILNSLMKE